MPSLKRAVLLCTLLGGLAVLGGCGGAPSLSKISLFSSSKAKAGDKEVVPNQLYGEADGLLEDGKFTAAAKKFEEVDRQHPYSPFARRSLVMAAYSHYKSGDYDKAILTARRYTTLHPGTKENSLATHIIASSYYDQIRDPARDQSRTKKALKSLQELVTRFPDSKYAAQAVNRIRITKDVLAASEMNVGRYYLKKNNYLASINRFRTVVVRYQTTPHVEEALMRLTETYMAMGITNEAQTAAAVLGHNFPNSKWYKDAYALLQSGGLEPREDTGSWISRRWKRAVSRVSRRKS
ncbi:MAG: outer membrane protein assembly factor BamD [Methyloligellaceae bacterium]